MRHESKMKPILCQCCGYQLSDINEACPHCLPNFYKKLTPPPVVEFQEKLERAFSRKPSKTTMICEYCHKPIEDWYHQCSNFPACGQSNEVAAITGTLRALGYDDLAKMLVDFESAQIQQWGETFGLYRQEKKRADSMEERLMECLEYMKGNKETDGTTATH
jgi:hypothetical protein